MSRKPKRTKPGSIPRATGRAMRKSGMLKDGIARTFLGEFPAEPERLPPDPEWEAEVRAVIDDLPGNDARDKVRDVKFLSLIAPGEGQLTLGAAWKKLHPKVTTMKSATEGGSRRYREIRKAVGDKGVLALWGVHIGSISKTLSDAQRAMFVRQFITRDGTVVTAPALIDHNVRLQAAALAMKLLGKGRDVEPGTGAVVVNIIQYAPVGSAPWPGAVWPRGFPAGSPPPNALPAATDFTGRKGERDD